VKVPVDHVADHVVGLDHLKPVQFEDGVGSLVGVSQEVGAGVAVGFAQLDRFTFARGQPEAVRAGAADFGGDAGAGGVDGGAQAFQVVDAPAGEVDGEGVLSHHQLQDAVGGNRGRAGGGESGIRRVDRVGFGPGVGEQVGRGKSSGLTQLSLKARVLAVPKGIDFRRFRH
jgi:hypothetical protein